MKNRWSISILLLLLLIAVCDSCQSVANLSRRSIAEFRKLRTVQGDCAFGWQSAGAVSAANVVSQFGNPTRTEDLGDFCQSKVLYYPAKDEFGNPCLAALVFYRASRCGGTSAPALDCYSLGKVQAVKE